MDFMLLCIFQRQVELQCRAILAAAHDLDAALAIRRRTPEGSAAIWIAVQNLLNATANVSKACWGQGGRFAAERKDLRDSLGIPDTSPLKDPDMRNNFEHYDERIDLWWQTSTDHNHMDMGVISPLSGVHGLAETDMFRIIDPAALEVIFWGQRFALRPTVAEALRILPIAEAEGAKPHWDPAEVEARIAKMGFPCASGGQGDKPLGGGQEQTPS